MTNADWAQLYYKDAATSQQAAAQQEIDTANQVASEYAPIVQQQQTLANQNQGSMTTALDGYMNMLGMSTPGSPMSGTTAQNQQQTLENSPGYQFSLNQGNQAVQGSAAARGMLNTSNTIAAVDQYSQGLAQQTYQNQVGNLASAYTNTSNASNASFNNLNTAMSGQTSAQVATGAALAQQQNAGASMFNNYANTAMSSPPGQGGPGGGPNGPNAGDLGIGVAATAVEMGSMMMLGA